MSGLTFTEVDGVPVVLAPTDGPGHAGLVFRVGRADEPLNRAGITHLVEHLALHRHGVTDYHYNGLTASTHTIFHASGSEDDIVGYLNGVCAGLAELPFDRLETEKSILRTEAAGRGTDMSAPLRLALWRHGAAGYGTVGYPEFGLHTLREEHLRDWVDTWFTAGNAVLWIAGDRVPPGLRLALPTGPRRPLPAPTSALPERPAFYPDSGTSGVAFDAWVPRGPAVEVYAQMLQRALFRELRQEGGYSYTVAAGTLDAHGDRVRVHALADAAPDQHGAVLGGFLDVLTRLRVGTIDPTELASVRATAVEALRRPEAEAGRLPQIAMDMLVGYPATSAAERAGTYATVTVDDVRAVAQAVWDDALLMAPRGTDPRWAGLALAPMESESTVPGIGFAPVEVGEPVLQIGAEGVTRGRASVRFDECAVVLAFPDGSWHVLGRDAIGVAVDPRDFLEPAAVTAAFDAVIPPHLLAPQPAQAVRSRRTGAPAAPEPAPRPAKPSGWYLAGIIGLSVMAACMVLCGIASFGTAATDPDSNDPVTWGLGVFSLLIAAALIAPAVGMARRRRAALAYY